MIMGLIKGITYHSEDLFVIISYVVFPISTFNNLSNGRYPIYKNLTKRGYYIFYNNFE